MHAAPPIEQAKEVAAEPVEEMLTERHPIENPVEKPLVEKPAEVPSVEKSAEVQSVEKLAEIPQPAVNTLIDLSETLTTEKLPENSPVEKTIENAPVEKRAENPPVKQLNPDEVSIENPLIDFRTNEDERVTSTTKVSSFTSRSHFYLPYVLFSSIIKRFMFRLSLRRMSILNVLLIMYIRTELHSRLQ